MLKSLQLRYLHWGEGGRRGAAFCISLLREGLKQRGLLLKTEMNILALCLTTEDLDSLCELETEMKTLAVYLTGESFHKLFGGFR